MLSWQNYASPSLDTAPTFDSLYMMRHRQSRPNEENFPSEFRNFPIFRRGSGNFRTIISLIFPVPWKRKEHLQR